MSTSLNKGHATTRENSTHDGEGCFQAELSSQGGESSGATGKPTLIKPKNNNGRLYSSLAMFSAARGAIQDLPTGVDQQNANDSSLPDAIEKIRRLKIEVDWKQQQLGFKERENYRLKLQLLNAQQALKEETRLKDVVIRFKDEDMRKLRMEVEDLERQRDWYKVGTEMLEGDLEESKKITTHLLGCLTSALIEGCYSGCSVDALLEAETAQVTPPGTV
ncbi:hypothetical protein BKA70DRAFT_1441695 [Coprinopsis sp. MPI-PUGE-AT-0042]|nr:hypothetical protein BKA70DRAFT_1441695 [Coprinopsis sp. MPI-PUGE-AT-0042]